MRALIVEKFTSGRWILTVIIGFTFAYLSIKHIVSAEASMGVIVMVIRDYFSRQDRPKVEEPVKP